MLKRKLSLTNPRRQNRLNSELSAAVETLPGWCTMEKAQFLYQQVVERKFRLAVEVGVFGGRSLVPIALAVRQFGGIVYGIEPWDNAVAVEVATNEANDAWWTNVDMGQIKKLFFQYIVENGLLDAIHIIELPSSDAVQAFSSPRFGGNVEFIHIDGAHSEQQALFDVKNWYQVLRPGGMIVLDDISWPTVQQARQFLKDHCIEVTEVFEDGGTTYGAYLKQ